MNNGFTSRGLAAHQNVNLVEMHLAFLVQHGLKFWTVFVTASVPGIGNSPVVVRSTDPSGDVRSAVIVGPHIIERVGAFLDEHYHIWTSR